MTAIIVCISLLVAIPRLHPVAAAGGVPRVGASAGSFAVDANGGSTYTMPVTVPPGTAGRAPSIALAYSKTTGNSYAGAGFSVTGLSVIHRCGRTIALDGVKGGVNYDGGDRFCLDGQRLIAVSGSDGGDGTEYRTERETFNRVYSHGSQGGGPQSFRIVARDGGVTEYGVTDDSRIEAQGKAVVRAWAVNRVLDSVGNYYAVNYAEDNANGDYRPARIDYTGNSETLLPTYNSVRFTYGPRPDTAARYEGGSVQRVTQRLTKIETYAEETVVRSYDLAYDNNGAAGASRLTSVQECGSAGTCLLPTTFGYQAESSGFTSDTELGSYASGMSWPSGGNHWGDVNGDGRADFVYLQSGTSTWRVMLSSGTSLGPDTAWGTSTQPIKWDTGDHPRLTDINGDGRADLIYYQAGTGATWRVLLSTGTSFATDSVWGTTTAGISSYGGSHQFFLVDFNGDAKTDIVYLQDGTAVWRAALSSTGSDTLDPDTVVGQQSSGTVSAGGYHAHYWSDVSGDGRADLVYQKDGSSTWHVMPSTGPGLGPDTAWGSNTQGIKWDTGDGPRLTDVNADGRADLVYYQAGTGATWRVLLSTGTSFATDSVWGTTTEGISSYGGNHQFFLTDADGDTKTDIVYLQAATASWRAALSSNGTNNVLGSDAVLGNQSSGTVSIGGYHAHYSADVNGDGRTDIAYLKDGTTTFRAGLSTAAAGGLLTTVTNGLGATVNVTYKPLTDPSVYTRDTGGTYPYVDVQSATYVVSRVARSDGLGDQYAGTYGYTGARTHVTGPGWLGFRTVANTDERNGVVTTDEYTQNYESGLIGNVAVTESKINTVVLKRDTNSWAGVDLGGGRRFARLDRTQEETFDLASTPTGCTRTDNTYSSFDAAGSYGNYGLPSTVTATTAADCGFANAFVKTTTNTYTHDLATNILGKLTRAEIVHQAPGIPAVTRTSSFTYTPHGLTAEETIEPDSATLWSKTSYAYDNFGNRTGTTVTGADVTARTSSAVYASPRHQFQTSTTNALGHTSSTTYDPRWGTPLTQTDPNGLVVTFEYDGFGRRTKETRPDGSSTTTTYAVCDTGNPCPSLGNGVTPSYVITTQAAGSAPVKQYHDLLDRVVRTASVGLNGTTVYQDTWYDNLGRTHKKSQPYFANQTPTWTITSYDTLNRPSSTTDSAGATTATSHTGLTTTETITGVGITTRSRTTIKNALGKNVSVTDSLYPDKSTTYLYDAVGNLTGVTDPANNQATLAYDLRGRKTQMSDPDLGAWTYAYNSLGELVAQTDSKSQTQTATYDTLGRITTRTMAEGTSTWTYDTATKGVGKLASVSSPGGFTETHAYDAYGRPAATTATLDGQTYTTATTYDSHGRVNTLTYPTGFAIKNVYNTSGHLTEIRNNQTNTLYWQANNADARGHVLTETLGNGLTTEKTYDPAKDTLTSIRTTGSGGAVQDLEYTWDVLGNLLSRTDHTQNLTESFQYDTLNRLTEVTGPANKTFQYNEIGNITAKSDVGTYTYPTSGAGSSRPHAVTQVSGTLNHTYAYDANGNMTSGAGRTITYTSFNKPNQITSDGAISTFTYDANLNRVKKTTPNTTTVYIGKLYERITTGPLVEHRHYINGTAIQTSHSDGTSNTYYLLKDHLSSIETITDENGNTIQKLSFDANGKRRNSNWTDATQPITAQTPRGYTGHEMDDEAGLINMNAREYDPTLGRFLQPDTIVETPYGQGLNRYTYVLNNPLSHTDPTGQKIKLKNIVKMVVVAVITAYTAGVVAAYLTSTSVPTAFAVHATSVLDGAMQLTTLGQITVGAVSGAVNGALMTGTAKGAAYGAVSGALGSYLTNGAPQASPLDRVRGLADYATSGDFSNAGRMLGNAATNYGFSRVGARIASHWGISPQALNIGLMGLSIVGNATVDSRFRTGPAPLMEGVDNRGPQGWLFDIADVMLGYQGLPTASTRDYLTSPYAGRYIHGHSLGTLDVAYLTGNRLASGGNAYAMPLGNVAPPNVDVYLGGGDAVTGGPAAWIFNPGARACSTGFLGHSFASYIEGC